MSEMTAGEIYDKVISSVVLVTTTTRCGSGVVVGDGLAATCCHLVEDGEDIAVLHPCLPAAQPRPARVVAASRRDLCLLEVDGLTGAPVELAPSAAVRAGDWLCAVGHALSSPGALRAGTAAESAPGFPAPAGTDAGEAAGRDLRVKMSLPTGFAGGGVFDRFGRLAGFAAGQIGTTDLQHCLPSELAGFLLQRAEVEGPVFAALTSALTSPSAERLRAAAELVAASLREPLEQAESRRMWCGNEMRFGSAEAGRVQAEKIEALGRSLSDAAGAEVLCAAGMARAATGEWRRALQLVTRTDGRGRDLVWAHALRALAKTDMAKARALRDECAGLQVAAAAGADGGVDVYWAMELAQLYSALGEGAAAVELLGRLEDLRGMNGALMAECWGRLGEVWEEGRAGATGTMGTTGAELLGRGERCALSASLAAHRLRGLALTAYHAARGGAAELSRRALESLAREEAATAGELSAFGESHSYRFVRRRLEAEARFLTGDVDGGLNCLRRMRVLRGDLVSALSTAAIAVGRE